MNGQPGPYVSLYEALSSYFNLEELKNLCYDLGVEYENLPGEQTRLGRARELVRLLERQDCMDDLLARATDLRPQIEWQRYQPAEPEAISPYKGLLYFDEADAPLFFGREQVTAELIAHLRQHCFLAVVGASGSGKSSVVRAGIIPAIRHGEVDDEFGSSAAWPIHVITPGNTPLKALAIALTRDSESVTAAITLEDDLRQNDRSLSFYVSRLVTGKGNGRLLLIVDQFEELFTQCRDATELTKFVGNLVTAVTSGQKARLSLIITLRADFYNYAVQLETLRPLLETRQKIVGAMTHDELRQAIEEPAAKGNWALQPGLVDMMLQDVGREPGRCPCSPKPCKRRGRDARAGH